MPGVVECLQAQQEQLNLLQQTCYCRMTVPTASTQTEGISQTSCVAYVTFVLQEGYDCSLTVLGQLPCTNHTGNQEEELKVKFT